MSKECCLFLQTSGWVIKNKDTCLRTAASLIIPRFDTPLSLILIAEWAQFTDIVDSISTKK